MRTHRHRRPRRSRRPLRLILRSPAVHWSVAAALAAVTALGLQTQGADLDRRAAQVGPTIRVAVVRAGHDTGDELDADDVEMVEVPKRIVPAGALRHGVAGRRLITPVSSGEVLVEARLAPGRTSRLAAAIPSGNRGIAVPLPPGSLRLSPGDRVDLLALTSAGTSDVIVSDGIVVATDDAAATVAVPERSVGNVADAVLASTLTITLTGPR